MNTGSIRYKSYADDDCRYPVEATWLIEYEVSRGINGDWNEPPEPGEVTITGKTLLSVALYVRRQGHEVLMLFDLKNAEAEFASRLDEELIFEAVLRDIEANRAVEEVA